MYKILVVDDSALMRRMISDFINSDPSFKVVDTAKNGQEAIEKTKLLNPDAITMDVTMPIMDGVEALRLIMEMQPTPVLMLSSLTHEGSKETMRALALGAIDFIGKPTGQFAFEISKVKEELLEKLHVAVRVNMKMQKPASPSSGLSNDSKKQTNTIVQSRIPSKLAEQSKGGSSVLKQIVAIGTSTGGPKALLEVLKDIPGDFNAPIVIVQHMPPKFTKSLALRLDGACQIGVVEAEEGMILQTGMAYLAPGGYQMKIRREGGQYRIKLTEEEPRNGHRPSVDVMFESLINATELKQHVVIMTGMGSDGAKGMQMLKSSGAITTIAESQETCIVYGMPRAAVELKCADYVLPLYDIAKKLIEKVDN